MISVLITVLWCAVPGLSVRDIHQLHRQEVVDHINGRSPSWKVDAQHGASLPTDGLLQTRGNAADIFRNNTYYNAGVLPATFDARAAWNGCTSIRRIPQQGQCGSCWAMSAADVITDRICIHSDGRVQVQASTTNIMLCGGDAPDGGCENGYADDAFKYYVNHGVVTGGEYNDNTTCQPYLYSASMSAAEVQAGPKKCITTCNNPSVSSATYRGSVFYKVENNEEAIMREIYKNGPVSADMQVFADLTAYRGGVYEHAVDRTVNASGVHVVRVVGWGGEGAQRWWLAANSWGPAWGESGWFRVRRVDNNVNFEKEVFAAVPADSILYPNRL